MGPTSRSTLSSNLSSKATDQELLKATLNNSEDLIQVFQVVRDTNGVIVDFSCILNNDKAEAMYGDVRGKRLLEYDPGIRQEGVFNSFVQVVETGVPQQYERLFTRGQFRGCVYLSVVKLGDGVATTTTDLTKLKEAERELIKSQGLLKSVVENTSSSIMVLKAMRDAVGRLIDFKYLFVNNKALDSVKREALVGKRFTEEFPGVLTSGLFEQYKAIVETGEDWNDQLHIDHDGVDVWSHVFARKLNDGLLVTYFDITAQKRAEEKIREQAHLIEQVTETVPDMISVIELATREITYVNKKIFKVHGFDPEEMFAKSREERAAMVNAEDRAAVNDYFANLLTVADNVICTVEYRAKDNTGTNKWFLARGKPFLRDKAGQVTHVISVVEDITARKHTEQEILRLKDEVARKATDKYLSLFNNMEQGFCIIEVIFDDTAHPIDYRFLEVNPAFEKQTGLHDAAGKTMRSLQPSHEEHWFQIFGQVAKTGKPVHAEQEAMLLTGSVWYDVYAFPYGQQQDHQVAILFNDITQRKKTELALAKSETSFRSFVTASSDSVYKMSADWETMCFLDGKDFMASTNSNTSWMTIYIPELELHRVKEAIAKAIQNKEMFELEHQVIDASGNLSWAYSRAVPLLNEQGVITEWIGAASNITERKRAEEALRKSQAQLAAMLEVLPVGVGFMDSSGQLIFSNEEMRRFLPTYLMPSVDEGRYKRWSAFHPDGRRMERHDFPGARAMRGERVVPGIIMLYTQDDGSQVWTRVAAVPVKIGEEQIAGQVATITDITELKQSEEALRLSEEQLKVLNATLEQQVTERTRELQESNEQLAAEQYFLEQVTDKAPLLIYVYDLLEQQFTYINKQVSQFIGRDQEYIYAMGPHLFQAILHPDDVPVRTDYMISLSSLQPDEIREMEFRIWTGRTFRWFRSRDSIFLKENQQVKQIIGIAEDITYEKMIEWQASNDKGPLKLN